MKKCFIFIIFILLITYCFTINNYAKTYTTTNRDEQTSLGNTIDIIKAESYCDIASNYVLDEDYYFNLTYTFRSDKGESNYHENNALTINKMYEKIQSSIEYKSNVDGLEIKGFTLGAKQKYKVDLSIDRTIYASTAFFEYYAEKCFGRMFLVGYDENHEEYSEHLSQKYIKALTALSKGELDYNEFFRRYGTHLIADYKIGDKCYFDTYIFTNSIEINESISDEIMQKISASFANTNANVDLKSKLYSEYSFSEKDTIINTNIHSDSTILSISESGKESLDYWCKNTSIDNSTIIKYNDHGLIPLWDILPSNSPVSRDEMIDAFKVYSEENGKIPDDNACHTFPKIVSNELVIRKDGEDFITKVKDCDRFSNKIDYFSVCSNYGLSIIKNHYSYLKLEITLDYKKKNKGNRFVYVYDKSQAYKGSELHNFYLGYSDKIECSKKNVWYDDKTIVIEINTRDMLSTDLAFVWRAQGSGDDTWENNDVKLKYCYYNKDLGND